MLVAKYKYKKDLKNSIGQSLKYQETSLFGEEYKYNGRFTVVGPAAYNRKWYGEVTIENGLIARVQ